MECVVELNAVNCIYRVNDGTMNVHVNTTAKLAREEARWEQTAGVSHCVRRRLAGTTII